MSNGKPRVLFLCTNNAARSQMAEALLRYYGGDRFDVCSAGLDPTDVHPLTRQVLEEMGVQHGGLSAKGLNTFLGKAPVRYAIVVCERAQAQCPRVYPFARHMMFWPFPDPLEADGSSAERLTAFRQVRDHIAERVRQFLVEGA